MSRESGLRRYAGRRRSPKAGEMLESARSESGCADFERDSTLFRARGGPIQELLRKNDGDGTNNS